MVPAPVVPAPVVSAPSAARSWLAPCPWGSSSSRPPRWPSPLRQESDWWRGRWPSRWPSPWPSPALRARGAGHGPRGSDLTAPPWPVALSRLSAGPWSVLALGGGCPGPGPPPPTGPPRPHPLLLPAPGRASPGGWCAGLVSASGRCRARPGTAEPGGRRLSAPPCASCRTGPPNPSTGGPWDGRPVLALEPRPAPARRRRAPPAPALLPGRALQRPVPHLRHRQRPGGQRHAGRERATGGRAACRRSGGGICARPAPGSGRSPAAPAGQPVGPGRQSGQGGDRLQRRRAWLRGTFNDAARPGPARVLALEVEGLE